MKSDYTNEDVLRLKVDGALATEDAKRLLDAGYRKVAPKRPRWLVGEGSHKCDLFWSEAPDHCRMSCDSPALAKRLAETLDEVGFKPEGEK